MSDIIWKSREPKEKPELKVHDFPVPRALLEVLERRNFGDDLADFLSPKLSSLRDPFSMDHMDKAVARIVEARKKDEALCIYADFDLDGTSGLALFKTGLEKLGFKNLHHYQPTRLSEGYGLHAHAVEELASKSVRLMISIDVGITAHAAAEKAKECGVDLIITDHHLPQETLPDAYAIVNPNKGTCPSDLGHLSGAGVAFYYLWAIKRVLAKEGIVPDSALNLKDVLDCFVIATLTDMVPLIRENRVLVKHGLLQLAQTNRPGLRYLLEELGFAGRPLSSADVAIRFAPKLNALSRMEQGVRPLDLYLVDDETEARRLVSEALRFNQMRVSFQVDAEKEAMDLLKLWPHADFVFVSSKNFHRGVVGLIATKLSGQYGLPAFVGSETEDGLIVGSARRPDSKSINLVEALASAEGALNRSGGHSAAAGFELNATNKEALVEKLRSYFEQNTGTGNEVTQIYDTEAELDEFTPDFMHWYENLSPFGTGFEAPLFRVINLMVDSVRELKGGHLRLGLKSKSGAKAQGLLFGPSSRHDFLKKNIKGVTVEALGEPQWNYYEGNKSIQFLIKDIHVQEEIYGETGKKISSEKENTKEI